MRTRIGTIHIVALAALAVGAAAGWFAAGEMFNVPAFRQAALVGIGHFTGL